MRLALELAQEAYQAGEIPVGAVVEADDRIVAQARNQKRIRNDATAHAELIALKQAAQSLQRWRLSDATLYLYAGAPAPCVQGLW